MVLGGESNYATIEQASKIMMVVEGIKLVTSKDLST